MEKQGDVGSYVGEQYLLIGVWLKSRISKVAVSRIPVRMRMTVLVPSLDGR